MSTCVASKNTLAHLLTIGMIIPINIPSTSASTENKLPPQLAKIGTDEIVLIELQGSFEVEGDARGQVAANLRFENVRDLFINRSYMIYTLITPNFIFVELY